MIACLGLPVFSVYAILNSSKQKSSCLNDFKKNCSAIDLRVKSKRYPSIVASFFFALRRALLIIIVFTLYDKPFVQLALILFMQFLILYHIAYQKPFENPFDNRLELFNEFCITILVAFTLSFNI